VCFTETNKFVIVCQFCNTAGCPLQNQKLFYLTFSGISVIPYTSVSTGIFLLTLRLPD